jgi:hypothetical protein
MPKTSQAIRVTRAVHIIRGVEKRFSPRGTYQVSGKPYTGAQIAAVFQRYLDAVDAVTAARAAFGAAVRAEKLAARSAEELSAALKSTVKSAWGGTRETFADFGWELPRRTGPKSVEAKAEGAKKARATRHARKTMGRRQREKIRAGS